MGAVTALLLAAGLSLWALLSPWRAGLALLVGTTLLVPATVGVPNPVVDGVLSVQRAVLLALVAGLLLRHDRAPAGLRTRPPPIVAVLGVYVAVAFVAGVLLAAPPAELGQSLREWLRTVDQLLVLVVTVVLVRARGARHAAVVVTAVAALTVVVAGVEVVAGRSVSGLLFDPAIGGGAVGDALELRTGGVRARAGAEFALQLGWLLVAMLPLAVVGLRERLTGTRRAREGVPVPGSGRRALLVGVLLLAGAAAVLATQTRSALLALPLVVALTAVLVRDTSVRLVLPLVGGGAVLAAAAVGITARLGEAADPGSIAVRFERLPTILAAANDSPFLGLGFAGLDARGVPTTDISYLLSYAETGAVGLTLLLLALGTGVAWSARGVVAGRDPLQRIAAAATVGAGAMVVGGLAFDAFSLGSSGRLFWILVAIGGVAGERLAGPHRLPSLRPGLLVTSVTVAAVFGVACLLLGPRPVAARYLFTTAPTETEALVDVGGGFVGEVLSTTVCDALEAAVPPPADRYECRVLPSTGGLAEVRIVAGSAEEVDVASEQVRQYALATLGVGSFEASPVEEPEVEPPVGFGSAPAWMPVLALGLAVLVPSRRPQRRPVSG